MSQLRCRSVACTDVSCGAALLHAQTSAAVPLCCMHRRVASPNTLAHLTCGGEEAGCADASIILLPHRVLCTEVGGVY